MVLLKACHATLKVTTTATPMKAEGVRQLLLVRGNSAEGKMINRVYSLSYHDTFQCGIIKEAQVLQ